MTRVHVKDKLENDITIEMPALEKKKITFESPTLTVTDAGFDSAVAKKIAPPKAIPEADAGCAAEATAKKATKKPALGKGASKQIAAEHKPAETPEGADLA